MFEIYTTKVHRTPKE